MAENAGYLGSTPITYKKAVRCSHPMDFLIKNVVSLCLIGCLMACGTKNRVLQASDNSANGKELPEGQAVNLTPAPEVSLNSVMAFLTSDALMGREAGTEGIGKAALYLEEMLEEAGIDPYFSTYRDTLDNFEGIAYNLVGIVEGNDPELKNEYIIIGAHYDHIGVRHGQVADTIANGANDNASGTATVLEIARYFGRKHTNGRSLIFAFFSAEEEGLLGSDHLARRLREQDLPLYLMLNFEMTGVPMTDKDYLMYVTGYDKSNLAEICNGYAGENIVGFLPTAEGFGLFQRSDNYPFHQQFNVPSQTFCTFDFTNFDQYHKVGDELQLMDLDHMATLAGKMAPVIEAISNATTAEIRYN